MLVKGQPAGEKTMAAKSIYSEMIELIARGGGPASIIAFHPSNDVQDRAYALIDRKLEGKMTAEEAYELAHYVELEHILRMAKVRARIVLGETTVLSHSVNG